MGLKGNLTAGEIVEQLVHANAISKIRNVVFMVRDVWCHEGSRVQRSLI